MTLRREARLATGRIASAPCLAAAMTAATVLAPLSVRAQTVGPGEAGPQSVTSGTLTVVGGTNITSTMGVAFSASGAGTGILDTTGGPIGITASGPGPNALRAEAGGTILSIGPGPLLLSATGVTARGAEAVGGTISLQNATITATGTGSAGVVALSGGSVTITGGTIAANGLGAAGVMATGGAVDLTDVAVSVTGVNALGGIGATEGSTITGNGVTVATTDADVPALVMGSAAGGPANVASFTNSTLSSTSAPAIAISGGLNTLTLASSSVTGGPEWLDVLAGGVANVTASGSTLTGSAFTEAGSTSNVALQGGTLWTMTGSANLTSLTSAASTINFTPPVGDPTQLASYKTLTVTDYAGANGTLGLNTFLGTDGSPSDRLVVGVSAFLLPDPGAWARQDFTQLRCQ